MRSMLRIIKQRKESRKALKSAKHSSILFCVFLFLCGSNEVSPRRRCRARCRRRLRRARARDRSGRQEKFRVNLLVQLFHVVANRIFTNHVYSFECNRYSLRTVSSAIKSETSAPGPRIPAPSTPDFDV